MAGGNITKVQIGEKIILGGLLFQIVAFSFFLIIAISFDRRQRQERSVSDQPQRKGWKDLEGWKKMLSALYTGSALLLVRNTFRVIEYIQGNDGYLLRNEVWLYIFDAVLMFGLMFVLNVVHPGEVLADESKIRNHEGGQGREIERGSGES